MRLYLVAARNLEALNNRCAHKEALFYMTRETLGFGQVIRNPKVSVSLLCPPREYDRRVRNGRPTEMTIYMDTWPSINNALLTSLCLAMRGEGPDFHDYDCIQEADAEGAELIVLGY